MFSMAEAADRIGHNPALDLITLYNWRLKLAGRSVAIGYVARHLGQPNADTARPHETSGQDVNFGAGRQHKR